MRLRSRLMKALGLMLGMGLLFTVLTAESCDESGGASSSEQRARSVQSRTETFGRAEAAYPIPYTENFPLREALVKFTKRQDLPNHLTYVYVVADTGQIMGYFTSNTYPVNLCAFLSSTENVRDDESGNLILTAPSLDGIYYGGAGASASCDGWFIFDAVTDALIEVIGFKIFVVDAPLNIEAQPLSVIGDSPGVELDAQSNPVAPEPTPEP